MEEELRRQLTLRPRQEGRAMRDTVTVAGWVGGAMLISVSLMVLCQHAEGERADAFRLSKHAYLLFSLRAATVGRGSDLWIRPPLLSSAR